MNGGAGPAMPYYYEAIASMRDAAALPSSLMLDDFHRMTEVIVRDICRREKDIVREMLSRWVSEVDHEPVLVRMLAHHGAIIGLATECEVGEFPRMVVWRAGVTSFRLPPPPLVSFNGRMLY